MILSPGGADRQIAALHQSAIEVSPSITLTEGTIRTRYWEDTGGALAGPGSFMEFVKHKLDEINAAHTRGALPISDFTRSTDSVTTYDSVVVFIAKRRLPARCDAVLE